LTEVAARGLTKTFGRVTAVRDMSFTAPAGTITGFLGPNGSGKTTTLRMTLGLIRPTGGQALIGGVPYTRLPHPRRQVGALLEATGFHPGRRARDHLRVLAAAERILGQLAGPGLARWLPFSASESLDRASLTSPRGLLPQWGGGLVLLAYAVAFAAAAVLITLKRDVT
jgi:ABC-type uncharacterized transport system ATPase subunit